MILLFSYALLALGISFLCSVAEAVLLCVTNAHISILEQQRKPSGYLLRALREDINRPLAAILTLNTIAHTVGAAGVGAQAAKIYGSHSLGVVSAVLTLLILVLSEIIPKTLGAHHWKGLAPATAHTLRFLVALLYPFVKLSELLTRGLAHGPALKGLNRAEMAAMAEVSSREGQLSNVEARIMRNLLLLRDQQVGSVMTPRTVVFSLAETMPVGEFVENFKPVRFSRIPIFSGGGPEAVTGYVLRSDLLLAHSRGQTARPLRDFRRDMPAIPETVRLSDAFDRFLGDRSHMMLVLDEYGGMEGVLTLEDVLETLIGREILDELDETADMRELARSLWQERARQLGLDPEPRS